MLIRKDQCPLLFYGFLVTVCRLFKDKAVFQKEPLENAASILKKLYIPSFFVEKCKNIMYDVKGMSKAFSKGVLMIWMEIEMRNAGIRNEGYFAINAV